MTASSCFLPCSYDWFLEQNVVQSFYQSSMILYLLENFYLWRFFLLGHIASAIGSNFSKECATAGNP
jgi:hypothetical protein